jgi:ferrochelatase
MLKSSQEGKKTIGILLMAYGSPESVDEIEDYLLDIRGGRATPPSLVEEIKERYRLIGGRSPLLNLTKEQACSLELELNRRFADSPLRFNAFAGMRHWEPRIKEAVSQMAAAGIRQAVALVMAPHSSRLSSGAYFSRLDEAIVELGLEMELARVQSWHDHPGLLSALAERARAAIQKFGSESPFLIFTAHSLPARILQQGDTYDAQLRETAALLSERLEWPRELWTFCYQSAGQSPEPWLGPQIEQVVVDLARAGEKNLLVVPIGFVCDHVEVLYDIDIACRKLAAENQARLERSESLNSSPTFIAALADLVTSHLDLKFS